MMVVRVSYGTLFREHMFRELPIIKISLTSSSHHHHDHHQQQQQQQQQQQHLKTKCHLLLRYPMHVPRPLQSISPAPVESLEHMVIIIVIMKMAIMLMMIN